jgi:hypothetical protein
MQRNAAAVCGEIPFEYSQYDKSVGVGGTMCGEANKMSSLSLVKGTFLLR